MLIGVLSDTHGYLNPRVPELLRGVDHILHAGDIGDAGIVRELGHMAPITAVRGNNDREGPASLYPIEVNEILAGRRILLVHEMKAPKWRDGAEARGDKEAEVDVVVFGHSHIDLQEERGGILFSTPAPRASAVSRLCRLSGFCRWSEGG